MACASDWILGQFPLFLHDALCCHHRGSFALSNFARLVILHFVEALPGRRRLREPSVEYVLRLRQYLGVIHVPIDIGQIVRVRSLRLGYLNGVVYLWTWLA